MKVRKGICYWPTFIEARAVSEQFAGSRVVEYGVGWAVQLRISGPYVGPEDVE